MTAPAHGGHDPAASRRPLALLAAALVAAALLYLPGLSGPFLHDDFGNIALNDQVHAATLSVDALRQAITVYPSRPLSMASFAANHAACGLDTACFKGVNLALHLLTSIALFFLLRALLRRLPADTLAGRDPATVAALATALWVLHPLHVSTTLYVVQRMTMLSALFSVLGLLCWLQCRDARNARSRLLAAAGLVACFLAATASKETGALLPLYIVLVEYLLAAATARARLHRVAGAGVVLLALALLLFRERAWHALEGSYATRDFTLGERLLSEARILLYYVSEIAWPDHARMSLYLDFLAPSRGLLSPWTTLPAVLAVAAAAAFAGWQLLRRHALPAFAVLFFLAGHLLESGAWGLVLAYEHRNYLPAAGLLLLVAWLVTGLAPRPRRVVTLVMLAACAWQLGARSAEWSSQDAFVAGLQRHHPGSAQAQLQVGARYLERFNASRDPEERRRLLAHGQHHLFVAATLDRQEVMALARLLMTPLDPVQRGEAATMLLARAGTSVPDTTWIAATDQMATCLVTRADCAIPHDTFAAWGDALLANPRLLPGWQWRVRRAAGTFHVRVGGDVERGLALAQAAAASGALPARVSWIKNLGWAGRTAEAEAALAALAAERTLDPRDLAGIRAAIDEARPR